MRFLILFLILAAQGLGATQTVHIKGTGSDETNVIVKLNLHHGYQRGDVAVNDIFLNKTAFSDFSNISFHGAADATLSHYLHSHGNYEVIRDNNKIRHRSFFLSDGRIVSNVLGIGISSDNGATYTSIWPNTVHISYVDSLDNIFIGHTDFKMYKSADYGSNWTPVLDMSAVSGDAIFGSIAEDSSGNLYFGRYQDAFAVKIYKSTDHGDTWSDITPAGYEAYQHVHGVWIDKLQTPEAIYVSLDKSVGAILRSTDAGATWVNIGAPRPANPNCAESGTGWRVFGGEASINGGCSILYTEDDATYECVAPFAQFTSFFRKLGTGYYATGQANGANAYAQIYRSTNGKNWQTIYALDYMTNATVSAGPRFMSWPGTPLGDTEQQILVGSSIDEASSIRIFDGGEHYSGLVFVEIPSLPAAGMDIVVKTGSDSVASASDNTIFAQGEASGTIAHWKLNEGAGTSVADSSGNAHTGALTVGTGVWSDEGSRAGAFRPDIKQAGHSFNFKGTDKLTITGSDADPHFAFTKNFTYLTWIKLSESSGTLRWVMGRGAHEDFPLALEIRTNTGSVQLRYYNGSASTQANSEFLELLDLGWHLISVSLDDATPPNITWSIDSKSTAPVALAASPVLGTQRAFMIGMGSDGAQPLIGELDGVRIVSPAMTAAQIRAIYESRKIPTAEASIDEFNYGLNPYEDAYVDTAVTLNNFTFKGDINVKVDATINNTIAAGIDIAAGKTAAGTYNLFTAAAKTGAGTYSDATHTLWSTDPLFASATSFRIKPSSPAINAGVDVGLTTDIEGKAIRGLPDIGAYEFAPAATNTILNRILFKRPIR